MTEKYRYSGIALAVLASLYEGPMHPYRMQLLIKQRGKDEVINVGQRAGLYQTIDRLLRAGLIAIQGTARDEKRPERTIYQLTEVGRETLLEWMREILSTPRREYPRFPAGLAYLPLLTPAEVRSLLEQRAEALSAEIERIDVGLADARTINLPRLFLVEDEYMRAMAKAELSWVLAVVDDLSEGRITWIQDWLNTGPDESPKE
jgi:DNA-binding PadR family transcriptional regulator